MTIQFNSEQTEALTKLSNFDNIYILKGYAGTGKTTVITQWAQDTLRAHTEDDTSPRIVLTAPTNKATGVLRDKARDIGLPIDVLTIHSLLGLKMVWRNDKQVLQQDKYASETFDDYDIVIIDECSMLDKELMNYIIVAQERANNKIIFMGDPCQLPPIGEPESESFQASSALSELTEVMRQARGNKIAELALYLRECILTRPRQYPVRLFEFIDDKHIFHATASNYEDQILSAFVDKGEEQDIRLVAWTNKVVDEWNNKIRDRVYGLDREEWTKGEAIVTLAPVIETVEKRIVFTTDTLLTIERKPKDSVRLGIPCWMLWCKSQRIYVPKKDSDKEFLAKKNELLAVAKADKKKWSKFYEFMEAFAKVRPAHSITVHRSQGSTFDDVYVSYQNILSNPNRKESLQCLYVAATRPRSRLFLI